MLMIVTMMISLGGMSMRMSVLLVMVILVTGAVLMIMLRLFAPVLFPGHIFFAIHPHIHFRGRDAAAGYARDFQAGAYTERRNRVLQQFRRDSGVNKRAQKHVATDTGKALKISNSHRESGHRSRDIAKNCCATANDQ